MPDEPSTETEIAEALEKPSPALPGQVQDQGEAAFEAEVDAEAKDQP
jgi:hypothetical protein